MNNKLDFGVFTTTSSAGFVLPDATVTVGDGMISGPVIGGAGISKSAAEVQKAVYAHIQALRALGRTNVNTVEVARALSLPLTLVDAAVESLKTKGVKTAA